MSRGHRSRALREARGQEEPLQRCDEILCWWIFRQSGSFQVPRSTWKQTWFWGCLKMFFFLHPNSYVHDLSYTSKKLQIETHFMEHIWIWLSTDFWGSLFSEQPTQFCECKKDQASSKTKGDWALISPEMVESTSFKVGTICQHLLQVSQKNKLCVLFFLLNRVICSCSFTLSPSNDRLNELFISRIRNEPCEISSWPPAGSMSYYDILFESIFVSTIFPGRKPWVFNSTQSVA